VLRHLWTLRSLKATATGLSNCALDCSLQFSCSSPVTASHAQSPKVLACAWGCFGHAALLASCAVEHVLSTALLLRFGQLS
jgi:hypothetical protein